MPLYAWVIIVLLAVVVAALVILAMRKRKLIVGFSDEEREELATLDRDAYVLSLQESLNQTKRFKELAQEQEAKLQRIDGWYRGVKNDANAKKKADYEALVASSDALIGELDRQLKERSSEDGVTKPGKGTAR